MAGGVVLACANAVGLVHAGGPALAASGAPASFAAPSVVVVPPSLAGTAASRPVPPASFPFDVLASSLVAFEPWLLFDEQAAAAERRVAVEMVASVFLHMVPFEMEMRS